MSGKPAPVPNADTKVFWDACNDERLIYQLCQSCGHAQFYPRSICVRCESRALDWRDAKAAGTIHTFSIVHRAPTPAFRVDAPYVLALIDLEDGFRMMMNVIDCDPETVRIGMAVNIVFEERDGQRLPQATPAD